jgi:hypothetical protein
MVKLNKIPIFSVFKEKINIYLIMLFILNIFDIITTLYGLTYKTSLREIGFSYTLLPLFYNILAKIAVVILFIMFYRVTYRYVSVVEKSARYAKITLEFLCIILVTMYICVVINNITLIMLMK